MTTDPASTPEDPDRSPTGYYHLPPAGGGGPRPRPCDDPAGADLYAAVRMCRHGHYLYRGVFG